MDSLLLITQIVSPLLYLISFIFYLRGFIRKEFPQRETTGVLLLAIICHFTFLAIIFLKTGHLPLGEVFRSTSLFALITVIIYVILEFIIKERAFGIFVLPVILLLQIIAVVAIDMEKPLAQVLTNLIFEVHVLIILSAYAGFALSFISSIMYIMLFYEIHGKHLGFFYTRLPSLKFLDEFNIHTVTAGFIFLSLGIILGIYNSMKVWGIPFPRDPKMEIVLINWLIYALLLISHRLIGWRGTRTSYLSILGFGCVLVSFMIISTLFSHVHSF